MKEIESSISTFQTHHSIILTTGTTFHFEQAAGDDFTAGLTPYTMFPRVEIPPCSILHCLSPCSVPGLYAIQQCHGSMSSTTQPHVWIMSLEES